MSAETHHLVSTYIDLVEDDINALMKQLTKKLKSNLTYMEHNAMEELTKKKDLILNHNWQLSEKASYKQLTQYPTLQRNRIFNHTTERFKNEKIIPPKNAVGLKVSHPKTFHQKSIN